MSESPNVRAPEDELPRQRVRLFYEKGEAIKFISHMDEFRMWERTIRRADLPLLYKQGFNPQPHMQFAAPLGVGITGVYEPLDIILSPPQPIDEVTDRIRAKLPPGVQVHSLEEMPLKTDTLQSRLIGADYTIIIYADPDEIAEETITKSIDNFLEQEVVWMERERKSRKYTYNLRPLIFELSYKGYDVEAEEHRIFVRVQSREGATGRPDDLVSAMGLNAYARTLRRDHIYNSIDPEDVAIFEKYPIITKSDIMHPDSPPDRVPKYHKKKKRRGQENREGKPEVAGRSINERAGDEFS